MDNDGIRTTTLVQGRARRDDRSRDERRGAGRDHHRRGGAGDRVLAAQKSSVEGRAGIALFALAGKFWPMGEAYEEKAYRKAGLTLGGIGVLLMAACGRAMKRREKK